MHDCLHDPLLMQKKSNNNTRDLFYSSLNASLIEQCKILKCPRRKKEGRNFGYNKITKAKFSSRVDIARVRNYLSKSRKVTSLV